MWNYGNFPEELRPLFITGLTLVISTGKIRLTKGLWLCKVHYIVVGTRIGVHFSWGEMKNGVRVQVNGQLSGLETLGGISGLQRVWRLKITEKGIDVKARFILSVRSSQGLMGLCYSTLGTCLIRFNLCKSGPDLFIESFCVEKPGEELFISEPCVLEIKL